MSSVFRFFPHYFYRFATKTARFLCAGEVFGWHVTSAGDLNKDGIPDVLVGAPYKDVEPTRSEGAAFVFNSADGKLLLTLSNPVPRTYAGFGLVTTPSPDMNHDGCLKFS